MTRKRLLSLFMSACMVLGLYSPMGLLIRRARAATEVDLEAYGTHDYFEALAPGHTHITSLSAGQTLSSGTYYINTNFTVTQTAAGGKGLVISGNVTLVFEDGATLSVRGGNGSGTTAGGAGIHLPSGSKLTLMGKGSLRAIGGNGGSATGGSDGAFPDVAWSDLINMRGGDGGRGGNGGGGAAAGIGTGGGYGGGGAGGNKGGNSSVAKADGGQGAAGNSGGSATAAGQLIVKGAVTVSASGGSYVGGTTSGGGSQDLPSAA